MNRFFSTPAWIAAGFFLAIGSPGARDISEAEQEPGNQTERYVVRFVDRPLAAYRGTDEQFSSANPNKNEALQFRKTHDRLDVTSAAAKSYIEHVTARRMTHIRTAERKLGRKLTARKQWNIVLNAAALDLSAAEAKALAVLPGVISVERDVRQKMLTDRGPKHIGSQPVWNGTLPNIGPTRGEGIIIGILDSGIVTHPSFRNVGDDGYNHINPLGQRIGDCVTQQNLCTNKLIGRYNFTTENDSNDLDGHGTHVASIAAGNVLEDVNFRDEFGTVTGQKVDISGVAPHASIIAYKVCELEGCLGSDVVQGIEQAVIDGVDVLNHSIGFSDELPWDNFKAAAFLGAYSAGIAIANSAGNDGPGAGSAQHGGSNPWMFNVAAATHTREGFANADALATFSSRGPNLRTDVLAPNMTAPGVNIFAAWATFQYATISGTSMASPHIAGAMALMIQAHPDWSIAEVMSALMTTANRSVKLQNNVTPADYFEMGTGRAQLDKAIQAPLLMDESAENIIAANPTQGGSPYTLNMPYLVNNNCARVCSWTRTFAATTDDTWNLIFDDNWMSADTNQFSLQAGENQTIEFTADLTAFALDSMQQSGVTLAPVTSTIETFLPVAVRKVDRVIPDRVVIRSNDLVGTERITGIQAPQIDDMHLTETGLAPGEAQNVDIQGETGIFDPYGSAQGREIVFFDVAAGTQRLVFETTSSEAPDVDMFVGIDLNSNGQISANEERCNSGNSNSIERCEISDPEAGSWWVALINFAASSPNATDTTILESIISSPGDGNLLAKSLDTIPEQQPFDLLLSWANDGDAPAVQYGSVGLSRNSNDTTELGVIAVDFLRESVVDSTALPDVNQSGAPEVGTLFVRAGKYRMTVVDAVDGSVVSNVILGFDQAIAIDTVPDSNNDGRAEIAVLVLTSIGDVRVKVYDPLTGTLQRLISFPSSYAPRLMSTIPDVGNGTPGVIVLGINDVGDVRAQLRDAADGSLVRNISFAPAFVPWFMASVPDVTGNGLYDVAVLGVDASGTPRVQLKDAVSGTLLHWIQYAKAFVPRAMVVVPDAPQGPAIAVLGEHIDGRISAQVKYAQTQTPVVAGRINFSRSFEYRDLIVVPDLDGNGVSELGYFGVDATGKPRVQMKDSLNKSSQGLAFFSISFPPESIVVLDDADSSGFAEISVLGINATGLERLQTKDAESNADIGTHFIP